VSISSPPALIMAGGRSQRMRTGNKATHKGLREVLSVPLIEWNLGALFAFGFQEIFVAVNTCESELITWVKERGREIIADVGGTLNLLIEHESLGTIGAAGRLPQRVRDVLIINVDNLTDLDLRALIEYHEQSHVAATVATHEEGFRIPFGSLDLKSDRVTGYHEKPVIRLPISSGTYVLNRRAMDRIVAAVRTDVPDLIGLLLSENEPVAAFRHSASWIDVNDEAALARAEQLLESAGSTWPYKSVRKRATDRCLNSNG
jgi:NDP-sugar pyrophosphorylase family protein